VAEHNPKASFMPSVISREMGFISGMLDANA
jgi:hypothetical protein